MTARKWKECTVPDCDHLVSGLSRWCNRHKLSALRYGSPTATKITKRDLQPFARTVTRFIRANEQHPALLQVFTQLDHLLVQAATVHDRCDPPGQPVRTLRPRDWSSRRVRELARLHAAGVTGGDLYRAAAAVWLFHHYHPDRLPPGKPLRFAMARAVLELSRRYNHRGPTRRVTNRLSTLVLDALGQELVNELSDCLSRMVRAIDSRDNERSKGNV